MKDNTMGFDASIACFIDKHTGGVICLKEMDKVEEIALPSITTQSMIDKENSHLICSKHWVLWIL